MDDPRDFLSGMIVGALVGLALGLVFAPDAGTRTRERIKKKSGDLTERLRYKRDRVEERIRTTAEGLEKRVLWVDPLRPGPPWGPLPWGGPQKPPEPPPPREYEQEG